MRNANVLFITFFSFIICLCVYFFGAQQQVSAQATNSADTVYCLGSCPQSPTPSLRAPTAITASTTTPCPADQRTSSQAAAVDHHRSQRGGFLEAFFKLILLLFEVLLSGKDAPNVTPCLPTTVQPSPLAVATTEPTIPVVSLAPTVQPTTTTSSSSTSSSTQQRIAVVYSDNTTGISDGDDTGAMVALLQSATKWNFKVITAGPNGTMTVQQALAQPNVVLYGQPGASGDDTTAYNNQKGDTAAIQHFVKNGGRYLGICMGQFLAEPDHYNLFPGDIQDYDDKKGLSHDSALVQVTWRGKTRQMYFQDGGYMVPNANAPGLQVLAKFTDGTVAAAVANYGKGKVGVSGPHPEAPQSWYSDAKLTDPDGLDADLGRDLIDTLMQ